MNNIKLTIAYNGSEYFGSQIQPDQITIQSVLQNSMKILNIDTKLEFSGRTDKGVHAFRQVVSCKIPPFWVDLKKLKDKLNRILPNSIVIRSIKKVPQNYHARFSTKKREYRYLISPTPTTPFNCNFITYYKDIDIERINSAIKLFIGVHDFEYFSKKGSEPLSTIREIYDIKFYKHKNIFVLQFKANSYLRSQIRMMVSFIMDISANKLTLQQLKNQISKKELVSFKLAPPNGLYLSKII